MTDRPTPAERAARIAAARAHIDGGATAERTSPRARPPIRTRRGHAAAASRVFVAGLAGASLLGLTGGMFARQLVETNRKQSVPAPAVVVNAPAPTIAPAPAPAPAPAATVRPASPPVTRAYVPVTRSHGS